MPTIIPWRPARKPKEGSDKPDYNVLPDGVLASDYSLPDFDALSAKVKVEAVTRAYRHVLNNEAIAGWITALNKADGPADNAANRVAFMHKFRTQKKAEWLDGTWGTTRGVSIALPIDPVTAKMQVKIMNELVAYAEKAGKTGFPSEYNPTTAKVVVMAKSGKTLAQVMDDMFALDIVKGNKVRNEAIAEVEAEKAAQEAARLALMEQEDDEDNPFADESEAAE